MANYELIIEALKLYREKLQSDAINIEYIEKLQSDVTNKAYIEKLQSDITSAVIGTYRIDTIVIALQEVNNLLNEYSSAPLLPDTGEEPIYGQYYDLALRYNTLYFRLMDICH